MTDKQRIENLKGQVEHLTAENEKLKKAMSLERSDAIATLLQTYEELINELKEKKDEYTELIESVKIQWAAVKNNIN